MARKETRRGWWPWAALAGGIALILTAAVLIHQNQAAPTDAGTLPAAVTVTSTTTVPRPAHKARSAATYPQTASISSHNVPSSADRRAAPRTSSNGTASTPPATVSPTQLSGVPRQLVLPSLGVTADIVRVDSVAGVLQVPDDISTVGWWQNSVPAGSLTGTTVIDGHIDSAAAGEGALFHLANLGPGDHVQVRTATGRTLTYQVQARRVYVKADGLPAELFNQQGPARLVIISCGGPFDATIHSYEDNIAIYATPTTT